MIDQEGKQSNVRKKKKTSLKITNITSSNVMKDQERQESNVHRTKGTSSKALSKISSTIMTDQEGQESNDQKKKEKPTKIPNKTSSTVMVDQKEKRSNVQKKKKKTSLKIPNKTSSIVMVDQKEKRSNDQKKKTPLKTPNKTSSIVMVDQKEKRSNDQKKKKKKTSLKIPNKTSSIVMVDQKEKRSNDQKKKTPLKTVMIQEEQESNILRKKKTPLKKPSKVSSTLMIDQKGQESNVLKEKKTPLKIPSKASSTLMIDQNGQESNVLKKKKTPLKIPSKTSSTVMIDQSSDHKKTQEDLKQDKKLELYGEDYDVKDDKTINSEIKKDVLELFINNKKEVNVDRLLCLHLLTLKPAVKCSRMEQSLGEKYGNHNREVSELLEKVLVIRLMTNKTEEKNITRYSNILPHYLILSPQVYSCECFKITNKIPPQKDEYACIHIIVNRKIELLINTMLNAIKRGNPKKVEEIWLKAHDSAYIKKLLETEKFQDSLNFMKNHLQEVSGDDFVTGICEIHPATIYGINRIKHREVNMVFLIELPKIVSSETIQDTYYTSINNICLQLTKENYMIPYREGLCILQNPKKPCGIAIVSEDGKFIALVTGPHFNKNKLNLFENIAIYVKFRNSEENDYKEEWKIIKDTVEGRISTIDLSADSSIREIGELSVNTDAEELNEIKSEESVLLGRNNPELNAKVMGLLSHEDKKSVTIELNKTENDKKSKISKSTPISHIFRKTLSINSVMNVLKQIPIDEREKAMKSSNYGGLGFARIIFGKKKMLLMKNLCHVADNKLKITTIGKKIDIKKDFKVSFKIPEDLDQIYQVIHKYERKTSNKNLFKEIFSEDL